jgi:hypothetical protein
VCHEKQHNDLLEMFMSPCLLTKYITASVHDPTFAAYDLSFSQILERLTARIDRTSDQWIARMGTLHAMIEEAVYLVLMVTYLKIEAAKEGTSKPRRDVINSILSGKGARYERITRDLSVIIGKEPSETIKDMGTLRDIVEHIIIIICRHITRPEHFKSQVVAEIFSIVTTNPFFPVG